MVGVMAQRRGFLAGVVLAAVLALVVPVPAAASPARLAAARPLSYVALGDSYSSGNGTGRYDLDGWCRRSSTSYPALWARRHRPKAFTFLACSGAAAPDVTLRQALRVPGDADLVTVTLGGNDAGFSFVLRTCTTVTSDDLCIAAIRVGQAAAVTTAPAGLAAALAVVKRRAPHARLVVLGYPRLFETGPCSATEVPSARRRAELNRAADVLVTSLAEAARASDARFVDVRGRFAGHGVCAPPGRAWINSPDRGGESYHPNATGYARGYLPALTAAIG
jgi:lysophospholipase L1-like esterase